MGPEILDTQGSAGYIASLAHHAVFECGVPEDIAHYAAKAAERRFRDRRLFTRYDCDRAHAYYWAIVRRRGIESRSREHQALRHRYLVASLVDDLRQCGRSSEQIWNEMAEQYRGLVSEDILDDLCSKLTA
ncbi:MAG: hypothetical protein U1E29_04330 [Coriobacteriia bacterium]|nr:hypothetical protein [Coriobacteriia bacterium]